jgi:succinate dehydrogenase hydrophobic anchor subunit
MAGPAFRRPTAVALVVLLVVFIAATVVRQEAKHRLSATQEVGVYT